jgi:hypothetical protein
MAWRDSRKVSCKEVSTQPGLSMDDFRILDMEFGAAGMALSYYGVSSIGGFKVLFNLQ